MDDNIASLLSFIEPRGQVIGYHDSSPYWSIASGQTDSDNKRIKSSVACRYVLMLLIVILQGRRMVIVQWYITCIVGCEEPSFLKLYSSKLVSIADFFKGNTLHHNIIPSV